MEMYTHIYTHSRHKLHSTTYTHTLKHTLYTCALPYPLHTHSECFVLSLGGGAWGLKGQEAEKVNLKTMTPAKTSRP